jgi:hypothetical protein
MGRGARQAATKRADRITAHVVYRDDQDIGVDAEFSILRFDDSMEWMNQQ